MPSYFCKILTEMQKILKKCKNNKIGRLTEERGSAKINWLEKWRRKGGNRKCWYFFLLCGLCLTGE